MAAWWVRTGWRWFFYGLAAADAVVLASGWSTWDAGHRLLGCAFLVLAVHVTEEWFLPGGFHVQYNTLMRSALPDRFPMSRLTDSITVVLAMGLGLVIIPIGGTVLEIAMATFALLEVLGHTVMGTVMLRRLRPYGKRTIYGPGGATAYALYLPLAVALLVAASAGGATGATWLLGTVVGLLYGCVTALLPEFVLKSPSTPYGYTSGRYFERWSEWL